MPKNYGISILITGSKGYIGSRLRDYLIAQKYKVRGLDIKTGTDICDYSSLEKHFELYRPDFVIHCAAQIGRLWGEEQPGAMLRTNILGTLNVVKLCSKYKIKLINFATSEVCFPAQNIYGISKVAAEDIVSHYTQNYGLKAVSIRPFMIYGPGIHPSKYRSALDQFVAAALRDKALDVHKGTIRSWLHINDFIKAIEMIIEKDEFISGMLEVYDIGSDDYRSMESVARKIVKQVGRGRLNLIDAPSFLTLEKKWNFSYIKLLGWKPTITLEKGLVELIKWHKTLLK